MDSTMRIAIMQPYFLPYIGYWQLMHYVDIFVVYDDIEYTKKSWINRNRFLLNGKAATFTLPLRKASDFLDVNQRYLSDAFETEKVALLRRLDAAYRNVPYFDEGKSFIAEIFECNDNNLFQFIYCSIEKIHARLGMSSRLLVSSSLEIPRHLRGQNRVIATCKALNATDYINPIGGVKLYNKDTFRLENINLCFQNVRPCNYPQFNQTFVPHLSIIDPIMFIGFEGARALLREMELS